jgi:hypothetical protein
LKNKCSAAHTFEVREVTPSFTLVEGVTDTLEEATLEARLSRELCRRMLAATCAEVEPRCTMQLVEDRRLLDGDREILCSGANSPCFGRHSKYLQIALPKSDTAGK